MCSFGARLISCRLIDQAPLKDVCDTEVPIYRVGFPDVNEEEVGLIFGCLVPVLDVPDIASKRSSGVACEYERGRARI